MLYSIDKTQIEGSCMKYVTIKKFSNLSGYTQDAIRAKLKKGVWIEPIHWRKAPDGRILLHTDAITQWIEGKCAV